MRPFKDMQDNLADLTENHTKNQGKIFQEGNAESLTGHF
jgi:hypothetical protein